MIISFFEEFPTKENLEKLSLINFPTKLYLASTSIKEFKRLKSSIKSKFVKEVIYWPILKKSEGYWFSPFSSKKAIKKTLEEIKDTKTMIDLEMPYYRYHIITKLYKIFNNRKILNSLLKKENIIPCEHFLDNNLMSILSLNYPKNNKIKMIYTSHLRFSRKKIEGIIRNLSKRYSDLKVGLGIIAHGIEKGKIKTLSPEELWKDLELCKKYKIKEIIIFRLSGLNKEYVKIIHNFV